MSSQHTPRQSKLSKSQSSTQTWMMVLTNSRWRTGPSLIPIPLHTSSLSMRVWEFHLRAYKNSGSTMHASASHGQLMFHLTACRWASMEMLRESTRNLDQQTWSGYGSIFHCGSLNRYVLADSWWQRCRNTRLGIISHFRFCLGEPYGHSTVWLTVHTPRLGPTMSHCPSTCNNWLDSPSDSSAVWLRSEGIGNGISGPFASRIAHGMQRRFAIIVGRCPSQMMPGTSIGYMRTTIGAQTLQQQSFWRKESRIVVFASWFVSDHVFFNHLMRWEVDQANWAVVDSSCTSKAPSLGSDTFIPPWSVGAWCTWCTLGCCLCATAVAWF